MNRENLYYQKDLIQQMANDNKKYNQFGQHHKIVNHYIHRQEKIKKNKAWKTVYLPLKFWDCADQRT